MKEGINSLTTCIDASVNLRVSDLLATTAGTSRRHVVRVLLAMRVLREEYGLDPGDIVTMTHSLTRPTPAERRQCATAYSWLYENQELARWLYEIEQC